MPSRVRLVLTDGHVAIRDQAAQEQLRRWIKNQKLDRRIPASWRPKRGPSWKQAIEMWELLQPNFRAWMFKVIRERRGFRIKKAPSVDRQIGAAPRLAPLPPRRRPAGAQGTAQQARPAAPRWEVLPAGIDPNPWAR